MTLYEMVQALVLTLVIGGSVAYAFRQYFPKSLRQRLGTWMQRSQHARWMQAVGAWLVPASGKAGCASGCSSCGGCEIKTVAKTEQPLVFTPRGEQQKRSASLR
jgi:hypothetical protein